ncbi:MAG: hypothetical protein Q8L10_00285, partial [Candidatus Moranbacteria bacterium]|nr:hypothetical protein [Candidatus Moranbacteria bacterium]
MSDNGVKILDVVRISKIFIPLGDQNKKSLAQGQTEECMRRSMSVVRESRAKIGYREVRDILGENFVSPEDIGQVSGIHYGKKLLRQFIETLPAEDVVCWLRDNDYVLISGPPLPMLLSGIYQALGVPIRLVRIGKRTFS